MEDLKKLVRDLESKNVEHEIISQLQVIGSKLLKEYVIEIGNITIEPLLIEAYYYNDTSISFLDCNCHQNPMQKGNFGKLYQHTKTVVNGGVDICLSPKKEKSEDEYYLSFLIKVAVINGKVYKQEAINGELLKLEDIDAIKLKPTKKTDMNVVCVPRKNTKKGKYSHSPLSMFSVELFKNEATSNAVCASLEKCKQWVLAKYALEKAHYNIERAREIVKEEGLYIYRIEDKYIDSALKYINDQNN